MALGADHAAERSGRRRRACGVLTAIGQSGNDDPAACTSTKKKSGLEDSKYCESLRVLQYLPRNNFVPLVHEFFDWESWIEQSFGGSSVDGTDFCSFQTFLG